VPLTLMRRWRRGYDIVAPEGRHIHEKQSVVGDDEAHLAVHRRRAIVRTRTDIKSPDIESFGASIFHVPKTHLLAV
jgi:hypothetical protein